MLSVPMLSVNMLCGVRLKQRIRFPLFERLFRRISILHGASRRGGGGGMLYVSGALRRTYTLFYPHPMLCVTTLNVTILGAIMLSASCGLS
jgi:hypothetical protein